MTKKAVILEPVDHRMTEALFGDVLNPRISMDPESLARYQSLMVQLTEALRRATSAEAAQAKADQECRKAWNRISDAEEELTRVQEQCERDLEAREVEGSLNRAILEEVRTVLLSAPGMVPGVASRLTILELATGVVARLGTLSVAYSPKEPSAPARKVKR